MFLFKKPQRDEVIVVDDFLDKYEFKVLRDHIEDCNSWGFTKGISVASEGDPRIYYGFSAGVVDEDAPEEYLYEEGFHIQFIKQLNERVKEQFNLKEVIRCRLDMTTYRGDNEIVFGPHIDCDREHTTSIFYVTDSDAPTIIYNEKRFCGEIPKDIVLTEKQRIVPKQNRLVIFPGNHVHTGMCPINYPVRILINTNYRN
ncbi:DenV [Synechococcus phage SynMITS9220M01]|nr:DenV [Synechococcus phage SynMITS9220M01]